MARKFDSLGYKWKGFLVRATPEKGTSPGNVAIGVAKALTQNLISALNKLPAYLGMAYRHDKDFPGFKELNHVGAVVTDMVFLSTTREANTLKEVVGSGKPEMLSVIKSKSGRFIKPGSLFNQVMQDENEVLFKPGTRFKVNKRVEAKFAGMEDKPDATSEEIIKFNASNGIAKTWTTNMDG